MRTREKENIEPVYNDTVVDYDNPNVDDINYGPYLQSADSETMTDQVTSNYGELLTSNGLTSNPCSYIHSIHDHGSGSYRSSPDAIWPYTMYGDITGRIIGVSGWDSGLTTPTHSDPGELLDIAKARAVANINPATFNFAEDFAEIRETIEFLKSPMRSTLELIKSMRRSALGQRERKLSPRKTLELLSSAWLEYRFAVSPLVRSAYDAYDAYHQSYAPVPRVSTARGRQSWSESVDYSGLGGTSIWWGSHSITREIKTSASIKYSISNPTEGLRAHLGIRNEDIPETLWQIMPLSFMVDRVSNVSDFVRGVTNLLDPRISVLDASYVTRDLTSSSKAITANMGTSGAQVTSANYHINETFTMDRVVWDVSIGDTVPSFTPEGLVSSAQEVFDLASLIIVKSR